MALALLTFAGLSSGAYAVPVVYGAGTPENPKRISTCFQLHNYLNDTPGTNLTNLNFLITNNLDCTGYTFNNTNQLTGVTIDGGNHRITNITIGEYGFVYILDSSTIKNIWFESGNNDSASDFFGGSFANQMVNSELENVRSSLDLSCDGFCGGLVGSAQDSVITKSVYDGTLNAGSYSGGLVGSDLTNNTSNLVISKSAFLGTMTAPSYAGGILGSYAVDSVVEESYTNGVFDLGGYSGGIIGAFNNNILINKSYSAGSGVFSVNSGGIVGGNGNTGINVIHSYTVLNSDNNQSNVGNVEGGLNTSVDYNDVHYLDESGQGRCRASSGTITDCRAMTVGQSDTISVLLGFDTTNTWQLPIGEQPVLRLHQFGDPTGIPNGGDMNDDGIQDTFQGNVEVLKNAADNNWTAIETNDSNSCTLGEADLLNTSDIPKHAGYNILSDYVSFNVYCLDAGQSFTTNIYLDRNIDISNVKLLFYNPANNSYTPINGATFTHKTIGGQTFTVLSYTLTDGGPYDRDGVSNGKIEDPVVLANPTALAYVKAPNTGLEN